MILIIVYLCTFLRYKRRRYDQVLCNKVLRDRVPGCCKFDVDDERSPDCKLTKMSNSTNLRKWLEKYIKNGVNFCALIYSIPNHNRLHCYFVWGFWCAAIYIFFLNEPGLSSGIDPGMALTQSSSCIG